MVRLIPVTLKGKTVWVEDAPKQCGEGHEQLVPTQDGCPTCGDPVRQWVCRAAGCAAPAQIDDEHEHYGRRRRAR